MRQFYGVPHPSKESAELALEDFAYRTRLAKAGARIHDRDLWLSINPELHISENPFDRPRAPYNVPAGEGDRSVRTLLDDGYFVSQPIVRGDEPTQFRAAVEQLARAGYPSAFACVYDEFWRLFAGLEPLLSPIVGDNYFFGPRGLWSYYVPPGHSGRGLWGASGPHRDVLGPDPRVLDRLTPGLLNLWIPLTDVSTLHSCMYAVPAPYDPNFYTTNRHAGVDQIDVQDVRALPAPAGSVFGWSTHLLHWGSRSSAHAAGPRVSVSMFCQRRDVAPYHPDVIEIGAPIPFAKRVEWVLASLGISPKTNQI